MAECLICNIKVDPFMNFGKMPMGNGFLPQDEFEQEYYFNLSVGFCDNCKMVQLTERVDPDKMFTDHYPFFSSTSRRMWMHFEEFADNVIDNYANSKDPFVVEIGSNDGIMLQHFAKSGIRHLGIEPSSNVAQIAINKGLKTITKFFNVQLAQEIIQQQGKADAILGANVMCHIPDLNSVIAGVKILLKPSGVLIFEDPYLGDIIEKTSYDQIYDEHVFYFSVSAIKNLFKEYGLDVVDIAPQSVHGGSMRYTISHKGAYKVSNRVHSILKKEETLGLTKPEIFLKLRQNIERSREELMTLLYDLNKKGKRLAGYGATSKSTTLINYCGITLDIIEYISDTTPIKQGKFSPGAHIPIRSYEEFCGHYPDYALLFAWNHAEEIMEKEQKYKKAAGKWILYVPKVQVV